MKKLLIIFGVIAAFLAATAFITTEKANVPQPGGSCKTVGNCTVELRRTNQQDRYWIYTLNKNSYPVTVYWRAYGYVDGQLGRVMVGSGQIYASPRNGDGNASTGSAYFTTTASNVHLDDINVSRCD